MPKYKATVCRTSYSYREIEVEAKNKKEAKQKILDEAGDYEFSEKSAEYSLTTPPEKNYKEQSISFEYEGKNYKFKFTPYESDYWISFTGTKLVNIGGKQTKFKTVMTTFDVHYLEDEDNQICVYLVKKGETQTKKAIHVQKIVL